MIIRLLINIALWLLGASLIVASGGGAGVEPGEGGETRRFDQYPVLLEIAGNGVVVAGQRGALNLIADATQFRRNSDLNSDQTYGADLRLDSTAIEIFDPRPVLIHRADGSDFYDSKVDIAGAADVATVQRVGLRASNPRSAVSRTIFVVPAGRSYLASLSMSQPVVQPGSAVEAVLTLSQPAPAAGARVTLQVDSPALTVPAVVTIPAGATEVRFQMTGTIDGLQRYVIVTAAYDGVEQQAGLWVRAVKPFLLDLDIPERLTDGNTEPVRIQAKAILSGPAVPGQMLLRLQSNNALVTFPNSIATNDGRSAIILTGGQVVVPFELLVQPLFELGSVRITVELTRGDTQGSSEIVNQLVADSFFGASQIADLRSVSFSQFLASGIGIISDNCIDTYRGAYSEVTIKLSRPAPRDYLMEMYASNPSVLQLNRVFTIPEGQFEVRFRMDHVAGGPPETCTQVGPFCTSIGNYQRPDADMHRFTRVIVRALRTGKTLSFERWVNFRNFPTQPVIDPFTLDAAALRGGQTITGNFGVVTNNFYDDLPIAISVGNGPPSQYVWRAQLRANDRLDFALPTVVTDDPTTVAVVARSPIQCLGGSSDDPGQPAPSVRRSINLLPGGYLAAISLDKPNIFGGDTAQLTVQLNRPAGAGGLNIVLSDDFPSSPLQFPASVFVPQGSDRAVVNVSSQVVSGFTQRIIRGVAEGIEKVVNITLLPEPANIRLSVAPTAVVGGQIATIRVIADRAYPLPLPASLVSSSAAATVPASVTLNPIGSGPSEESYAITTLAVAVSTTATFTAQVRGQSASAQLRIDPPGVGNTLRNLTVGFAPGSAAGTVTSNPGSINCTPSSGTCADNFQDATAVTLTAVPAAGTSLTSNAGCDSFVPAAGATPAQCQVRMTNDRGVSFGFAATVPTVPVIDSPPISITVNAGQTATFSVFATGTAPLSYRWQRGGQDIAGAANASSYTTPPVTNADDGATFRVIVSNAAGSVTSQPAVLTVGRGWRQIGAAVATPGFDPTLALDSNGVRYVSYTQAGGGVQRIFAKRFDGSAWVPVGAAAVNATSSENARNTTLIIGANNSPVLAWSESTGVQVVRWNGAQWDRIGTDLLVTPPPDIASVLGLQLMRSGSDLIVAWIEFVQTPTLQIRIAVQRLDAATGAWSGGFVPNVTNVKSIRLAVDAAGFPTVAYVPDRGIAGDGAIQVVRQSATGWAALGGDVGPVPVANSTGLVANYGLDIRFDGAGAPVVFGSADGLKLFAFRFIANAWQPLTGADGVFVSLDPATESTALMAFTRGGTALTMAYSRQRRQNTGGLEFFTEFLNWNGIAWMPVGDSLRFFGRTLSPALTSSGTPIFAAQASSLTNEIVVQEFVP